MDIASLRIKFTPLLKNVRKGGSKCCLEIVPEVSAIQNLDRIQWTLEENHVEYRIPMTYRIILKKPRIDKESSENLDKTYHSCVDLMSKCSMTSLDEVSKSGDIKRILSENFVLSKITTDIEQCNVILNKNKINDTKTAKTTSVITLDVKPNSVLREPTIVPTSEIYTQNNESIGISVAEVSNEDLANHLKDNTHFVVSDNGAVNSDNDAVQSDIKAVRSRNQIIHSIIKAVHPEDLNEYYNDEDNFPAVSNKNIKPRHTNSRRTIYRNRQYPKHQLSLTPISSVNTNDDPPAETASYRSNLCNANCQMYKPNLKTQNSNTVLPKGSPNYSIETNAISIWTCHKESENNSNTRILPEVRIAQFKQLLEKEMFPLKLMLNEIQYKCSSLGLSWPQNCDKNIILYKSVPNFERDRQVTKCNRGVYTVVFDE